MPARSEYDKLNDNYADVVMDLATIEDVMVDPKRALSKEIETISKALELGRALLPSIGKEAADVRRRKAKSGAILGWMDSKIIEQLEEHSSAIKADLLELEKSYALLTRSFPKNKKWSFGELDQSLDQIRQELAEIISSIRLLASTEERVQETDSHELGFFEALSEGLAESERVPPFVQGILNHQRITDQTSAVIKIARSLMPEFRTEVASWNDQRLTAEISRRKRDLGRVPERQDQYFFGEGRARRRIPLGDPYLELRRFYEDVISELEAFTTHPAILRTVDYQEVRNRREREEEIRRIQEILAQPDNRPPEE